MSPDGEYLVIIACLCTACLLAFTTFLTVRFARQLVGVLAQLRAEIKAARRSS